MKNNINPFYSILLVSVILFASCAKEKKNELAFFNDLENVKGWAGVTNNEHTIIKGAAHSGQYLSRTDSVYQYGFAYKINLSQVNEQPAKKIKASVWVSVPDINSEGGLVVTLDSAGKNILWTSKPIKEFVKKTDEWTEVISEVPFPELKTTKDYSVSVYVWNAGKTPILADDNRVEFFK